MDDGWYMVIFAAMFSIVVGFSCDRCADVEIAKIQAEACAEARDG